MSDKDRIATLEREKATLQKLRQGAEQGQMRIVKLLETALELISVPEHAQDDEWQEKYKALVEESADWGI